MPRRVLTLQATGLGTVPRDPRFPDTPWISNSLRKFLVELSGPTPKEKRPPTPSIAKLEAAIKDAKFTGKGDLPVVLDMIREFNTLLHAQAEALADE